MKNDRSDEKPRVLLSACLSQRACRWNGQAIRDRFVSDLEKEVVFIRVCPEVEIGLGVPRDPIRVVGKGKDVRLVQPATGLDVTSKMNDFSSRFLDESLVVDGAILKSRSPSCGVEDVKVYPKTAASSPLGKASGFFGGAVKERYVRLALETEGRLNSFLLRDHFLKKLYTFYRFRKITEEPSIKKLMDFHAKNKFLLLAYSEVDMRKMGQVAANSEKKALPEVLSEYGRLLEKAFLVAQRPEPNINVLMHVMGFFSDRLAPEERSYFLETLEAYRRNEVPLSVPVRLLYSHILRFDESYLKDQTFFRPYPDELMSIKDSGKGRDRY